MWLRALLSGVIAQSVDTFIFVAIAFAGLFPIIPIIGGQLIAKVAIWSATVPLLYLFVTVGRLLDRTIDVKKSVAMH